MNKEHAMTAAHIDFTGRALRFGLSIAVLMLVMFVLAPLPIKHFAPMTHYVENAERNNINPGALYYTDVPVSNDAESNSRNTVRFFYK